MISLCFDYGHGKSDPGALYKGRKEKDDVLKLGIAVAKEVRQHGINVDETRATDKSMSLSERSSFERKGNYDYFISFHRNAFKPEKANGVETFTFTKQTPKAKSLATRIQKNLVGVGFVDRGVKRANFHVLRETRSPAVLIEVGFIDNTKDNGIFDSKFNEIVKAITKAILDEVGIKYAASSSKPTASSNSKETFYRVMAGSYKERSNAEAQMEKLKRAGFESTIMIYNR
ncbi:N-acetylmuramoyl-L-alanine amidase [Tissierella creatinophila]|uniref:Sporulation-specific N-acetylmuramoyl-L-alanine amidase n=1 Tax=Tissierella creatinophila DSM 6911 TaxID=1123403 RepID=A0A1U7M4P5_TISCR|nr:N-acetylmuramoyl-L-alanine amidase [Tissierella creatinophila]OLS02255.1 sporulation-specific N-acetylmuramoyl-L-alanine amidase [Tissierella creatinophila DSM 6911]